MKETSLPLTLTSNKFVEVGNHIGLSPVIVIVNNDTSVDLTKTGFITYDDAGVYNKYAAVLYVVIGY